MISVQCKVSSVKCPVLSIQREVHRVPPNSPLQLFQDTLEKVQEAIDDGLEKENRKAKTVMAVGDFNFPFISWPS